MTASIPQRITGGDKVAREIDEQKRVGNSGVSGRGEAAQNDGIDRQDFTRKRQFLIALARVHTGLVQGRR